jgi:hypothetical protein
MKPLGFVIFQLVVLGFAYAVHVRHNPSLLYRVLWLASICGVLSSTSGTSGAMPIRQGSSSDGGALGWASVPE